MVSQPFVVEESYTAIKVNGCVYYHGTRGVCEELLA